MSSSFIPSGRISDNRYSYGLSGSYFCATVLVLLVIGFLYIFPVIATFANTLKNLTKNAYIFAFSHFPSILAMAVITILPMYMTYQDLELLPLYTFCWFFFGFEATALINSYILYRIFKPYLEEIQESVSQ